jgi:hypothetical protein
MCSLELRSRRLAKAFEKDKNINCKIKKIKLKSLQKWDSEHLELLLKNRCFELWIL